LPTVAAAAADRGGSEAGTGRIVSVRNILVVTAEAVDETVGPGAVRGVKDHAHVHVVAPATDHSAAQWLANEQDEARREAERVAAHGESIRGRRERGPGSETPIRCSPSKTRCGLFAADEIVIVTGRAEGGPLDGKERECSRPLRSAGAKIWPASTDVDDSRVEEAMRELARGRRDASVVPTAGRRWHTRMPSRS
jgi:hypothetical protein